MAELTADDKPKENSEIKTLMTLAPYLWPRGEKTLRVRVVLAMICLALAKITNVYVPLLYKDAVDILSGDMGDVMDDPATAAVAVPLLLLLSYGGARVLTVIFQELRETLFAAVEQRAVRASALETFKHIHALSMRFHLERQTGGLSRIIERGIRGIEFLLHFMLFNIVPTMLELLLVCGILWTMFNVWYALVTLVTIVAYVAFTLITTEWRLKYRRRMNDRNTEANTKAIDSLLNYETVKYFSNEKHEADRYDVSLQGYERAAVKSIMSLSVVNIGQGAIISAGLVTVMYMAAAGVSDGHMTVGDFVLVNTYLIQLYQPLNFLGFVYRQIRQSLTDMDDMFSVLDIHAEIKDKDDAEPLDVDRGRIEFDHVDFSYDPERGILKDVSFVAEPGQKVAIVGPSGAGKSTISRLMFRFYDVDKGAVRIDGQDLRDVTQGSLRQAIGIVPQDTVLFNDTIYYNIAYGRPGASEDEVIRAAKLAHIHEFVQSLDKKYDTVVGERGLKLSGGEKQRVAIARTILKNPKILLFDEATSALDSKTEQDILQSLSEVSEGHTTLVIAHRLSTVISADEILVLRDGKIVERGTHKDLLAKDAIYADMWRRQQ